MKTRMVRYKVNLADLPPLTAAQKMQIEALRNKPDSEIDYSDIPERKEPSPNSLTRNPFYKPTKTSTTVRIDSDVLHWLRRNGKGYQSRLNAILRREMLNSLQPPKPAAPRSPRTTSAPPASSNRPASRPRSRSARSA